MFISKWGRLPLVIHPIDPNPQDSYNYDPYNETCYAYYHLNMGVNINGPISITNGEQSEWSVEVNSPHANSPYTYVWKIKEGDGNWTEISTNSSIASDDFIHSDNFKLKIIVTDNKGWFSCSEYKNVTVVPDPPPPYVEIRQNPEGPIMADDEYPAVWSAVVQNVTGSYSYRWIRLDNGLCVSNSPTYSPRYIEAGQGFNLIVEIIDNQNNLITWTECTILVDCDEIYVTYSLYPFHFGSIDGGAPFSTPRTGLLHYGVEWHFGITNVDGSSDQVCISNDPYYDIANRLLLDYCNPSHPEIESVAIILSRLSGMTLQIILT